jgi:hypothetical protein
MIFAGTSRFRVIRLLGSGGMGSVYLVEDRQLEAQVALKILKQAAGIDLYRFKREFRALVDLRHPNLVTLYDLFFEDDLWFFTMEYVPGVPFHRFLWPPGGAGSDPQRVRATTLQLCEGVLAMHEAGAIHRDLKPSNVLVTDGGRVVILDFGLAKQTTSDSLSGDGIVGTPTHMAPEQALEKPCTPAADLYAVGSMLYEALVGQPPFQGTVFEILLKKQNEDPAHPRTLRADVDADLADLCMWLMRRDPARRPPAAEILARLGSRRVLAAPHAPAHRPAARTPPLGVHGRKLELATLDAGHTKLRKGQLAVTLVQGTSGIGKTSLVEAFLHSLEATEADAAPRMILRGRCHEREALPFKAFDGVVDELSQRIDRLGADAQRRVLPDGVQRLAEIFPVLRRIDLVAEGGYPARVVPDARESRNQAFVAFRELLVRVARLGPLVVFIDDLQWADRDSFALLRALLQQPGAPAMQLVLACRPAAEPTAGDSRAPWRDVEEMPGVDCVRLGPLGEPDIRTLAEGHLPAAGLSLELRQRIPQVVASEASGNPFFAVELVRHFLDMVLPDGVPTPPPEGSDYRLDGMILKRIGGLPEESQRMLEMVALAQGPLPQRTLAGATGVSLGSDAWERGLTALVDARLLSRRGREPTDTVAVYHDRIAEAVLRHLDQATVRSHHLRLAEAAEKWERERKDKLARYWLSAEDGSRAQRYALAAAEEARAKLAFDRAAEFYQAALDLETDEQAKVELLAALGDCRASDGHAIAAAAAYQRAAAGSDSTRSLRLHHLAAEQLLRGGHIAPGLRILEDVMREVGLRLAAGPRRALWSVIWRLLRLRFRGTDFVERPATSVPAAKRRRLDVLWSAIVGLGMVDVLRAEELLMRYIQLALEVGDLRRVAQGLAVLSGQLAALGPAYMAFARRLLAKAEVLGRRSGDATVIGLGKMCRGIVHYFSGEWEAALGELFGAEEHFLRHCHGVGWELATTRSFICFALRARGRLRALGEHVDRYTADADRVGDRLLATNLRTYMSTVWQVRGDIGRARKDLEGALDLWPGDAYQIQHFFHLYARCELCLYEGKLDEALAAFAAEEGKFRSSAMAKVRGVRGEYAWLTGRLALAKAERAAPAERRSLLRGARQGARYLGKLDQQTAVGMSELLAAGAAWLLATSDAERATVVATLGRAVETLDAAGATSLVATGRYWLGAVVGGERGEEQRARALRWMDEEGVREPARFAFAMLPGFQGGGAAAPSSDGSAA